MPIRRWTDRDWFRCGSVDTNEIGDNNANIHVDVAINSDSSHIAVTRVNG
jgi:hypothetical protein